MKAHYLKILFCVFIAGASFYFHIYKQNQLRELKLQIPTLSKELKAIQEENKRLAYEIDNFESPIHLVDLMRLPEFSGLRFAYMNEVQILPLKEPIPGKDLSDLLKEDSP